MKILVAGLSKTGTKSMATALRLLGYEVYDWMENFHYYGDELHRQVRDGFRMHDIRRMYENVDAVTDGPWDIYWEEMFDAFPEVKVILTTRDDEQWLKSLKNQLDQLNSDIMYRLARTLTYTGIKIHKCLTMTSSHLVRFHTWPDTGISTYHDESMLRLKNRHERYVKMIVPKEQLLVYDVKEGWKPLCSFLGLPVPKIPFPHRNKGGKIIDEFRRVDPVMQRMERELKFSLTCLFVMFAFGLYRLNQWLW